MRPPIASGGHTITFSDEIGRELTIRTNWSASPLSRRAAPPSFDTAVGFFGLGVWNLSEDCFEPSPASPVGARVQVLFGHEGRHFLRYSRADELVDGYAFTLGDLPQLAMKRFWQP
jgi:hypothetical protein